ncbi:MAG: hypothetical protein IKS32_14090 [Solobacterium sp.]|nr:hypothetical protein [Solobacterium sp.]
MKPVNAEDGFIIPQVDQFRKYNPQNNADALFSRISYCSLSDLARMEYKRLAEFPSKNQRWTALTVSRFFEVALQPDGYPVPGTYT